MLRPNITYCLDRALKTNYVRAAELYWALKTNCLLTCDVTLKALKTNCLLTYVLYNFRGMKNQCLTYLPTYCIASLAVIIVLAPSSESVRPGQTAGGNLWRRHRLCLDCLARLRIVQKTQK